MFLCKIMVLVVIFSIRTATFEKPRQPYSSATP